MSPAHTTKKTIPKTKKTIPKTKKTIPKTKKKAGVKKPRRGDAAKKKAGRAAGQNTTQTLPPQTGRAKKKTGKAARQVRQGKAKRQNHTDRHAIRATKAESEQARLHLLQHMDSSGYITWSAKKRKYVIMGSAATTEGLVPCPSCGVGQLVMIRSPKSGKRFIGCTNFYGGCDASSPLLQRARLRATKKPCGTCGWPEVIFRYSVRQKWTRQCSNMTCPTRAQARKSA